LEAGFEGLTQPILMAMVYTLTTPIGVAIGIAVSGHYSSHLAEALLLQGILDSVSAGILIYDALVNLITVNITHR
jgi:zinc transporter 1/2/3